MAIVYKDAVLTLTETTAHFDQMCWPRAGKELDDLNWRLRYGGEPSRSDVLMAAEVCSAYSALVWKSMKQCAAITRVLRDAEMKYAPPPEGAKEGE